MCRGIQVSFGGEIGMLGMTLVDTGGYGRLNKEVSDKIIVHNLTNKNRRIQIYCI